MKMSSPIAVTKGVAISGELGNLPFHIGNGGSSRVVVAFDRFAQSDISACASHSEYIGTSGRNEFSWMWFDNSICFFCVCQEKFCFEGCTKYMLRSILHELVNGPMLCSCLLLEQLTGNGKASVISAV